ncbi:MAG: hypothetical protein FAZ92_00430 [Accumulibacter sp.]|jgi:hypothetical protein|uniref:hypothetical protein n=1 Tax=Accumulibacter sp. TaxID=2053492 RepID=UPI0012269847|nr:hypothetical protein [Accumulibacter sp.]QKS29642.1 MAG: hypothetical protein HT579_12430 [Candidatus Accumulibacter similis]TLD47291.1 MAG: hypothetical protein FAZ92_00430 [Accumulibacter sp.]
MTGQLFVTPGWHELPLLLFALALALVFFLVIRQNARDYREIEAWLAEEEIGS